MTGIATQRLQLYTPKSEAERTRQRLIEAATEHALKVESMTGSRGLLGYRVCVQVTGAPGDIEAFHRRFEGDGWWGGGGSDLAAFILNPILAAVFGEGQRSVASRIRRRKLQHQADSDDTSA